jgi:predicted nucleotidyltransferase
MLLSMDDLPVDDAKLQTIVDGIVEELNPERIYLFGSLARGTDGVDSDYDLLVVVASADEPNYRLAQRAHSRIWGLGVSADIIVLSKQSFDRRAHLQASLVGTVLREGTLLYAA